MEQVPPDVRTSAPMTPGSDDLVPTRPQAPTSTALAIPTPTAAVYDTVTEGKTGWRFLLTRRWAGFIVGALIYVLGCGAGVTWQWQLGSQIEQFNTAVSRNFDAKPVPLDRVLTTRDSYDPSEQWTPVTASGTYLLSRQLYVPNRSCAGDTGFEVLTPLRMSDGGIFIIDRGCVVSADPGRPPVAAPPPSGQVTLTARIVASESAKGAFSGPGDQIGSIDLPQIATTMGTSVYTGAYGMLAEQRPQPAHPLHPVISGKPTVDASAQGATIFATVLYAVVGLVIFGYALREKFRFVNRFDPRLWAREIKRIQRLARKPYTDAEIEDLLIDGQPLPNAAAIERAEPAAASSNPIGMLTSNTTTKAR